MKKLLIGLLLSSTATTAFAGSESYPNLASLKSANFYRLTCSDTSSEIQANIYVEVNNGKVDDVKIITIAPALSLNVIQFAKTDLNGIKASAKDTKLEVSGTRPGAYYDEELSLVVKDGDKGLTGKLYYNDGDGMTLTRKVNCGAVNYILNPSR